MIFLHWYCIVFIFATSQWREGPFKSVHFNHLFTWRGVSQKHRMSRSQRQNQPCAIHAQKNAVLFCRAKNWPCSMFVETGEWRTGLSKLEKKTISLSFSSSLLSGACSPRARTHHQSTQLPLMASCISQHGSCTNSLSLVLPEDSRPRVLHHLRTKTLLPTSYLK